MTLQNRLFLLLAVLATAMAVALASAYYRPGPHSLLAQPHAIPPQNEWTAALSTSTPQLLIGTVAALAAGTISVAVDAPPALGTAQVGVSSSTVVVKTIPKSPAEMAAAFKEFQRLQQQANGKPFTAPSAVTTAQLSISDLKTGDSVLVTLAPGSTKGHFVAQKIEVVPSH